MIRPFYWEIASSSLFPLALQDEGGPIKGLPPLFLFPDRQLSLAQRLGRAQRFGPEHSLIKSLHQFAGGPIVHLPQASNHTRRAGVHKPARQPYQPLALDLLAQAGLTGAQYHHIRRKFQVIDVLQPEKSVLLPSLFVDKRQYYARQLGMDAIEHSVGGEVYNTILAQF